MVETQGLITALVTPFTSDYQVNEDSLRKMIQRQLAHRVQGLFLLGSNGEFFSLSAKEKVEIAEIAIDEVKGKVPVYVGTGGTNTADVIQLSRDMKSLGVSAVSVITPYFPKLTQRELIHHYKSIADAVEIPIILYNIPAQTGNNLDPTSVAELSKEPNIVGIKDSSGSFDTILQYIEVTKDADFSILAGSDSLILATLMAGGHGGISATANFLPSAAVGIYESFKAGNLQEAELEQRKLRKIRNVFKLGSIPSVLKESLNKIGLEAGPTRLPVLPVTPEAEQIIDEMVKAYVEEGVLEATVL